MHILMKKQRLKKTENEINIQIETHEGDPNLVVRPFLKWAGNKFRVVSTIKSVLPNGKRLVEPFLGSGAVFLNTDYPEYLLGELNEDLVQLYNFLKDEDKRFIQYARRHFKEETNVANEYYARRLKFNLSKNPRERAALFIYLNRHGFNGLCRYNHDGQYNVPFGQHSSMLFPEERMKLFAEKAKFASIYCQDFQKTFDQIKKGDVVYCDPPYVPLSTTASFTNYSGHGFGMEKQTMLVDCARTAAKKGVPVLISNHDTPLTRELYHDARIISFDVARTISADRDNRKPVRELIAIY